jgi:hypothetical protein
VFEEFRGVHEGGIGAGPAGFIDQAAPQCLRASGG